jgi:hypothetical protein
VHVETTRFGPLDLADDQVIEFPSGLIGLGGSRYALVSTDDDTPFRWLQSLEDPDLALPVTSPFLFFEDYAVELSDADAARIGTDDPAQVAAMGDFGEALGLAFQMQDDLLDIWGDPGLTGKPYASDLLQRKMSLPMVHAYAHAGPNRAVIERIYSQDRVDENDVQTLLTLLDATGSRAHLIELASHEHDRALAALATIEPVDAAALEALRELADSLLNRAR